MCAEKGNPPFYTSQGKEHNQAQRQTAASCRHPVSRPYLPAATPAETAAAPWVFRSVFKEALGPKNKPLEERLPSWTRERLGMQLGTLPGAAYRQQERKWPLPPLSAPLLLPLLLRRQRGARCASPQAAPIPGPPPRWGGNPRAGHGGRAGGCCSPSL